MHFVEIFGMVLAVFALIVGVMHVVEIRHVRQDASRQAEVMQTHTSALEAQTKSLDRIMRAQTTRLLRTFPEYYEQIADLLGQAQEQIVVFCDHVAYGSFTKRATWEFHYHYNLKRQLRENNRRVELTCLDEDGRRESVKDQFSGPGKSWPDLKNDPDFAKKLDDLLKAHPTASKRSELPQEEFEDLLALEEREALDDLIGAHVYPIKADMPLYFWLIDSGSARARAIFAIPSFSEKIVEYGFVTEDQGLISAFEQMRDRYHKTWSATGSSPSA